MKKTGPFLKSNISLRDNITSRHDFIGSNMPMSEEAIGVTEAQNRSAHDVREDSRNGSTQKLPERGRLRKRSVVFILSGPSGAGKTTLTKFLLEKFPGVIGTTVSCTTRSTRDGETCGVEYHFITHEKFNELVKAGEFIEHVECYGNKYGTLKRSVRDCLANKNACIIDMDFEGAHNVLSNNLLPEFETVGVLILPPSLDSLEKRLISRNSENSESLQKRLNESFDAPIIANYKYVIINKDLEKSKEEILSILKNYEIY